MNRLVDRSLSDTLESRYAALRHAQRRAAQVGLDGHARSIADRQLRFAREAVRTAENVAREYVRREVVGLLDRAFSAGPASASAAGEGAL